MRPEIARSARDTIGASGKILKRELRSRFANEVEGETAKGTVPTTVEEVR